MFGLDDGLLVHAKLSDDGQKRVPCVDLRGAVRTTVSALMHRIDIMDANAAVMLDGVLQPSEILSVSYGDVAHPCGPSLQYNT